MREQDYGAVNEARSYSFLIGIGSGKESTRKFRKTLKQQGFVYDIRKGCWCKEIDDIQETLKTAEEFFSSGLSVSVNFVKHEQIGEYKYPSTIGVVALHQDGKPCCFGTVPEEFKKLVKKLNHQK